MTNRKGYGSGYILPNKQRVNQYEKFKCRVCNSLVQRNIISRHFRTKIHNMSVIIRNDQKYWNRNYCFDL